MSWLDEMLTQEDRLDALGNNKIVITGPTGVVGAGTQASTALQAWADDRILNGSPPAGYEGLDTDIHGFVGYHGAKGDGSTDDLTAINAALTANAGVRATWMRGATYKSSDKLLPPSHSRLFGHPGAKIKSTRAGNPPVDGFDGTIAAYRTETANTGTLTSTPTRAGISGVTSYGTTPPVITLTGYPTSAVKAVLVAGVSIAGGAARGQWTGKVTIDGTDPATSGTAQSFTSAATVAVTGSGLTLNIAAGDAAADNKWTAIGPRSLRLTMTSTPTAGNALEVAHSTCSAIYDLITVYGAASPYIVTLDREVVWAFVATDTAVELSAYPKRVHVEGLRLSGTGTMAMEVAGGADWTVGRCHVETGDGDMGGYGFVFDLACQRMRLSDFTVDLPDTGTSKVGVLVQSNENTVVERGHVRKVGNYAYWMVDNAKLVLSDCWAHDTGHGTLIGRVNPGTSLGSQDCIVRGGGCNNAKTYGLVIDGSVGTQVFAHTIKGAGSTGIWVLASSGTRLFGSASTYTDTGLLVDGTSHSGDDCPDTHVFGLDVSHSRTNGVATYSGTQIAGLICDLAAGEASVAIAANAGATAIRKARVTSAVVNGKGLQTNGGSCHLTDSAITLPTAGTEIGVDCVAGTTYIENVTIVANVGLNVANGATLIIGPGVDLSGCTTAISRVAGAIVRATSHGGRASIAMADANKTATFAQGMCDVIQTTGALTADRDLTLLPLNGVVRVIDNACTGANIIAKSSAGGTSVTCPAGSKTTIYAEAGSDLTDAIGERQGPLNVDGATTYSVAGRIRGAYFLNTAPVTITDFPGGVAGQRFTFRVSGATVTLSHASGKFLTPGGIDLAVTAYQVCTVYFDGTYWLVQSVTTTLG